MVHLGQEGGPAAFEALDDRELPEGPGPVEGVLIDEGRQIEELALGAGRGHRHATNVEVDVEGGVVGPLRGGEAEGRRHDPLAQPREGLHRPLHAAAEPLEVRRPVEERELQERRPEGRILLDRPHQCLGVAHAALEAQRTLRHRSDATRP